MVSHLGYLFHVRRRGYVRYRRRGPKYLSARLLLLQLLQLLQLLLLLRWSGGGENIVEEAGRGLFVSVPVAAWAYYPAPFAAQLRRQEGGGESAGPMYDRRTPNIDPTHTRVRVA